jgi:Skp family chaperone for outer membrane proteins
MSRVASGWVGRLAGLVLTVMAMLQLAVPVSAQQLGLPDSAILTISSERLYSESAFGRRVAQEFETESNKLASENRRIEQELTEEEQALTDLRTEMVPADFRDLADAFDAKVKEIRRAQDAKARALVQNNEAERVRFIQAARPILAELMREAGAGVILERTSVFLSANAIDVTKVAIARMNATIGNGANLQPDGDGGN